MPLIWGRGNLTNIGSSKLARVTQWVRSYLGGGGKEWKKEKEIYVRIHAVLLKFKYYKMDREEPSHSHIILNSLWHRKYLAEKTRGQEKFQSENKNFPRFFSPISFYGSSLFTINQYQSDSSFNVKDSLRYLIVQMHGVQTISTSR